jgi:hypothetical protein
LVVLSLDVSFFLLRSHGNTQKRVLSTKSHQKASVDYIEIHSPMNHETNKPEITISHAYVPKRVTEDARSKIKKTIKIQARLHRLSYSKLK